MNILFISHSSGLYGANKSLIDLIIGIRKFNVNPLVVIPYKGNMENALLENNIPYVILPVTSWVNNSPASYSMKWRTLKKLLRALMEYRKILSEWSIDIIYTNSSVSPIGRLVSFIFGKPHVWHVRELLDLHYEKYFIFSRWFSITSISSSKAIICNSSMVKDHFFKKNTRDKIKVVHNGVISQYGFDLSKEAYQQRIESTEKYFVIVGLLDPKKNQAIAIEAIAKLKERGLKAHLIIVGDGNQSYVNYCKNLVEQKGIQDRVEFTGYVTNPYEIYLRSFCLLVCSEFEAMGRVTVEGMSACLPVIAKKSGGTPEIMVHEKTGYLYDSFNELVDYMEILIKDQKKANEMGISGWEYAKDRFTTENYTENIYKIIKSF